MASDATADDVRQAITTVGSPDPSKRDFLKMVDRFLGRDRRSRTRMAADR